MACANLVWSSDNYLSRLMKAVHVDSVEYGSIEAARPGSALLVTARDIKMISSVT